MIAISGVLVDVARIYSASSIAKESLESASTSALAGYNKVLKDMYGLFALAKNDPDKINDEIEKYLTNTVTNGLDIDIKKDGKFFDMYGFNVEDVDSTPMYSLAENQVLRAQIVEYMKYRAPSVWIEGFIDKLYSFKGLGKQITVFNQKVDVDKKLDSIKKDNDNLAKKIIQLNDFLKI